MRRWLELFGHEIKGCSGTDVAIGLRRGLRKGAAGSGVSPSPADSKFPPLLPLPPHSGGPGFLLGMRSSLGPRHSAPAAHSWPFRCCQGGEFQEASFSPSLFLWAQFPPGHTVGGWQGRGWPQRGYFSPRQDSLARKQRKLAAVLRGYNPG